MRWHLSQMFCSPNLKLPSHNICASVAESCVVATGEEGDIGRVPGRAMGTA